MDPLTQFALLLQRLVAADYDLDITAQFDLPEETAALLDSLSPIRASRATGLVPGHTTWDGYVSVSVRLDDLGYRDGQLQDVADLIDGNLPDQTLLIEALLQHLVPFHRWVATVLSPGGWTDAARGNQQDVEVTITDQVIQLRLHATRIARAFQEDMARAVGEAT